MTASVPDAQVLHVLKSVWGYEQFRGVQQDIVRAVVGGENALVLMPTGGGKSLCYQVPSLLRKGVGVVVSPLIALMKDQVDALRENGVRAAYLNSSLSPDAAREVEAALLSGELDLLYAAPERLLTPRTLDLLARSEVALFAIDEAHCVSQWGHDFRPEYQGLGVLAERFPDLPRLALTATADERTRADIIRVLSLEDAHLFVSSFDRPNIQYRIQQKGAGKAGPKSELLDFIRAEHPGEAGIVYCLSRRSVEETAQWLSAQGVAALPYHAGLSPRERNSAQERFLQEEGLIVVATVAFGMGIDKSNVRFVAHLDLPKSLEGYYQETGRAGRDGLPSTAWMTYGLADVVNVRRMLAQSEAPEHVKRVEAGKLDSLLAYCETASCRRQVLLGYFGETLPEPCGNCDTCLNPPQTFDATRPAQMALSAAIRTGNRFGAAHLTDVLLGNATERVRGLGHHQLPTFGVGKMLPDRAWRNIMRQLVALGYLTTDAAGHGSLIASAKAGPLLKGEETLWLREDVLTPPSSKKARRSAGAAALGAQAGNLFEALRALRLKLAREQAVPPYVIFNDATLREMAERRPTSLAVLGTIGGVGTRKLAQYGETFLEVLRGPAGEGAALPGAAANSALLGILNRRPPSDEPPAEIPHGRLFGAAAQPGMADPEVAERLRELRRILSKETGHSAFVVFPNATLDALAERQPRSLDDLRGMPGLGEKRIEAYGERIVAAVRGEHPVSR
ncbi:DNA helicase RecQ [Deinococcus irradiatisoli]|uniref:DNA helicase RecQ n=1 Tax=Deinococcus irradiatisoli TaxID=2202254 RepID=A0A2Z3JJ37_9DEIO|nr:DNA helicase RecQ [Deinococcus irradiatisoli]AWN23370.1 DNA helicase RecQ [Deinococcus irradiatisoli]